MLSDDHEHLIKNLSPGQKYEVKVLAGTSQGYPRNGTDMYWTPVTMPNLTERILPAPPIVTLTPFASNNSGEASINVRIYFIFLYIYLI